MRLPSLRPRTSWSTAVYLQPTLELPVHGEPSLLLSTRRRWRGPGHTHTKADPFLFAHGGKLYLFHESQWLDEPGVIEAHVLDDGQWRSLGTILSEPFHLSYPVVFAIGDDVFLLPETKEAGAVRLYRFEEFPRRPVLHHCLLEGRFADPSPAFIDGRWYLFATSDRGLELFVTDDLVNGKFVPHPASPVVTDPRHARCGGVPLRIGEHWYRPAQDAKLRFGGDLALMRIDRIDPGHYAETPTSLRPFALDQAWNSQGGHHLDIATCPGGHGVAIAVDGQTADHYAHKLITRAWMVLTGYRRGTRPRTSRSAVQTSPF